MIKHLLQVLGVDGVEDVEEVLPGRAFAGRVLVGEVLEEFVVVLKPRPEILDRQLVVVRDCDALHFFLLHQLLFANKHVLEEVLVEDVVVGHVVLDCREVRIENAEYLRCMSRYTMKSSLDRSLPTSSCLWM